jgi:CRISPR-associated protein Csm4
MKLCRFRLVPESPWLTPWQSDTLAGLLCWACAHTEGDVALQQDVIAPALAGQPPFVLSDAFPNDWLPLPSVVRLAKWPPDQRKTVKRARWLSQPSFERFQQGDMPGTSDLIQASGVLEYTQLRNCIGRTTNTTSQGGELFPREESVLAKEGRFLTVYVRVQDGIVTRFWQWVEELASWGFGADRSAGKGQFRLDSDLEPFPKLDNVSGANGSVVLSTFQPASSDPADGAWEAFTKYGKLGPDYGLENVFKRPLILLRPGACFRASEPQKWYGRAIPMRELLAPDVVADLASRGKSVIHWACGLSLPFIWPKEDTP